jgi:hypothetical protein
MTASRMSASRSSSRLTGRRPPAARGRGSGASAHPGWLLESSRRALPRRPGRTRPCRSSRGPAQRRLAGPGRCRGLPRRGLRIRRPGCTHAEALTEPLDHLVVRAGTSARQPEPSDVTAIQADAAPALPVPTRRRGRHHAPAPAHAVPATAPDPGITVLGDDGRGHPAGRTGPHRRVHHGGPYLAEGAHR